jgi:hypothetical protein
MESNGNNDDEERCCYNVQRQDSTFARVGHVERAINNTVAQMITATIAAPCRIAMQP